MQQWQAQDSQHKHGRHAYRDSALALDRAQLLDRLLDHGIVKGHEKFFVSTAHSDEDIDDTIAAFEQVVDALQR